MSELSQRDQLNRMTMVLGELLADAGRRAFAPTFLIDRVTVDHSIGQAHVAHLRLLADLLEVGVSARQSMRGE